jgi:metal-dependent amidase/aminoacylase/carboxypeptidase family protein
VQQKNDDGELVPVMAACGHDMHVTCLMAAAKLMMDARDDWKGTLICLFQPNEEGGAGAQTMVDDGLYDKIPIPDLVLGQHVDYWRAETVRIIDGTFMATADSFRVTVHGRGGHGSQP